MYNEDKKDALDALLFTVYRDRGNEIEDSPSDEELAALYPVSKKEEAKYVRYAKRLAKKKKKNEEPCRRSPLGILWKVIPIAIILIAALVLSIGASRRNNFFTKSEIESYEPGVYYEKKEHQRRSELLRMICTQIAKRHPVIEYTDEDIQMVKEQALDSGNYLFLNDPEKWYVTLVLTTMLKEIPMPKKMLMEIIFQHLTGISPEMVYGNPYYRNIVMPEKTRSEKHHYGILTYEKGELIEVNPSCKAGLMYPEYVYLKDDIQVPCITEQREGQEYVWMSLSPGEILTMQQDIKVSHGNVLTLGLGLGYFAYMVHLKEAVSSVTIVEKDREIINMFQNYLLPQFDHPEKIRILEGDAFDRMKGIQDGDYDYLYGDLWEGPWDGIPMVRKLKEQTAHFRKTECRYWIEDMMYALM